MKKIIWCALLFLSWNMLLAQTPQYQQSAWNGTIKAYTFFYFNNNKIEAIYYPTDFPGMPRGAVSNIYLRVYTYVRPALDSVLYHNVKLSIGYTSDSSYPGVLTTGYDTFKTGLTTVLNAPTYAFKGVGTTGTWYKFPAGSKWMYDPQKKFVVQISHGYEVANNFGGIGWLASLYDPKGVSRMIAGYKDSMRTYQSHSDGYYLDLGFDIIPAGIDDHSIIRSFGLFPNPSTDGRFVVSVDAQQAIGMAGITVSSSVGQVVYAAQYPHPGASLFQEVALPGVPAGIYFVEVMVDGERITRRLCLQ